MRSETGFAIQWIRIPMPDPLLSVENVAVSFHSATGTTVAVKNVTYAVNRGETLAVVGESGSGKSVTARTIMGMLAPNARVGPDTQIMFDGEDYLPGLR